MPNELRDPHDPIIPGEHIPSPEGHGGVSMPIGQSNPGFDQQKATLPSAADLDAVEAEKDIADSTAKAEGAKGRVSRRP